MRALVSNWFVAIVVFVGCHAGSDQPAQQAPTVSADPDERVVATVNGHAIVAAEVRSAMRHARPKLTLTLPAHDARFETTLHEIALRTAVRRKLEQLEMLRLGILSDPSYRGLLAELAKENARRAKAIAENQIVYGPEHFDMDAFETYRHARDVIRLKERIELGTGPGSGPPRVEAAYKALIDRKVAEAEVVVMSS